MCRRSRHSWSGWTPRSARDLHRHNRRSLMPPARLELPRGQTQYCVPQDDVSRMQPTAPDLYRHSGDAFGAPTKSRLLLCTSIARSRQAGVQRAEKTPLRDHRQDRPGGPGPVVEDGLCGRDQGRPRVVVAAGVVIAVEVREVAAGDAYPYSVTGLEEVAGRIDLNRLLVSLAGSDR